MAFSMSARTFLACYAMWDDPSDDDANLAWLPSAMAGVEGGATGHYVAEADLQAGEPRAARSFAESNWHRLRDITSRLDPDGVFATYLGPRTDLAAPTRPALRDEASLRGSPPPATYPSPVPLRSRPRRS